MRPAGQSLQIPLSGRLSQLRAMENSLPLPLLLNVSIQNLHREMTLHQIGMIKKGLIY